MLPQEIKVSFATTSRPCNISQKINPYHPWDWYINPHEWLIFMVFMKVKIPYMDSMGKINLVAKVVGGGGGHGGYGGGGGGAVVVVILGKMWAMEKKQQPLRTLLQGQVGFYFLGLQNGLSSHILGPDGIWRIQAGPGRLCT